MRITGTFRVLLFVAVFIAGVTAVIFFTGHAWLGPAARTSVVDKLERRFNSQVELEGLQIFLLPRLRVTGTGLHIRHQGRTDVPPFISVGRFTARLFPWDLLQRPIRVRSLELEGLQIHIPPRRPDAGDPGSDQTASRHPDSTRPAERPEDRYPFLIDETIADGTVLNILPRDTEKPPLIWEIFELTLNSVGIDRPMRFEARLKNAKPPGLIDSDGEFGPWQEDDPGGTPVAGTYTFDEADLSVFKGIAGTLSSAGSYHGVLEKIEVLGTTDTPDFTVGISGNPVHLKTDFTAVVDGTNGDTLLQPLTATFGETALEADGGVTSVEGIKGKAIKLKVTVSKGRVEDLIQLAVKTREPFMVGGIAFNTDFLLPPGEEDVVERLQLDGRFSVRAARFTTSSVREKLEELSWTARGRPKAEQGNPDRVVSNMSGQFVLRDGRLRFNQLEFTIPGATVQLAGTYNLHGQQLDFQGKLRTQARLSQMTTGFKSLLLKAVDPFFARDGAGAVIPIKITGTQEQPKFGADF